MINCCARPRVKVWHEKSFWISLVTLHAHFSFESIKVIARTRCLATSRLSSKLHRTSQVLTRHAAACSESSLN